MNQHAPRFMLSTSDELEELTLRIARMAALVNVNFVVDDTKVLACPHVRKVERVEDSDRDPVKVRAEYLAAN